MAAGDHVMEALARRPAPETEEIAIGLMFEGLGLLPLSAAQGVGPRHARFALVRAAAARGSGPALCAPLLLAPPLLGGGPRVA